MLYSMRLQTLGLVFITLSNMYLDLARVTVNKIKKIDVAFGDDDCTWDDGEVLIEGCRGGREESICGRVI